MLNPKKTFYKVNSKGELETIRRTICPEGWLTQKPAFRTIAKKKLIPKSAENNDEELRKEILRLRQENLELKEQLEIEKAKEISRIESKFKTRLELENLEIERTSFWSRQDKIDEKEYYRIKNIASGLEARLQNANETIERLRQQHDCAKKNLF